MSDTPVMQEGAALTLVITEEDFGPDVKAYIEAQKAQHRVLGGDDVRKRVFDVLPSVIARRLERITPQHFEIAEVQMNMDLDAKIAGVGFGGAVTVTFAPRKRDGD